MQQYWDRIRAWCEQTVQSSAIKGLSESVQGKLIKRSAPIVLAYLLAATVLSSQLLLQKWPESFAAFLLGSPAIAVAMVSGLAIATRPGSASQVPLYACGGYAVLASLQCIMGSFAMCLPHAPNRLVFSLLSTTVVLFLCFTLSKQFVKDSVRALLKTKQKAQAAVVQRVGDDGEEEDDDADTASEAYTDAR